jgi:hypothetical protein
VPGAILPAGTYIFDHTQGTSAVTVSQAQHGRVIVRFYTIPSHRTSPGVAVTFRPSRPNIPPVTAVWYMDGGLEGYEFLYRADQ